MALKLVFLGTAGNSVVATKGLRYSGGIILNCGETQLHLDPGIGAVNQALKNKVNLRENTAVLVSHSHLNHAGGINEVLSAMSHNGADQRGVLILNQQALMNITEFHKKCVEKILLAQADKMIGIEDIDIIPLKCLHNEKDAIGYKIQTPEITITYSGDTDYSRHIAKQYEKSDVVLLNLQHSGEIKEKDDKGLTVQDAIKIIEQAKPELTILTHFGHKILQQNPVYIARELNLKTGLRVISADDGMTIDPVAYFSKTKQKTLKFFTQNN